MKEKYFKPAMEITEFAAEDILTTSILSDLFEDGSSESAAGHDSGGVSSWSSGDTNIQVAGS